ncbi:(2Fe-2S)-binding protein [Mycobacterium asiaticum]|uniref:(2Fe-2S)-binding protein n=1 Tax=Mycobacterium asiaticum TaxID=1790 RepID=UPI00056A80D0|nr:(2Fe-2S)-binding protein [Mycobacterium asiaticum]OBI86848.1 4-hydroxybenzoyl-CoA reductase subunit gamma [Mycobacterium asiaticum]ORA18708.1 4-hydroxybenzoyl-CoA reductase subunit gamma [Mycobacterium asiaticum DSM 44297]
MREITLRVNGRDERAVVEGRTTLAGLLRDNLGLTGTHLACEHGVCGACTVAVDGQPVRSCLMLAIQAEGATVETVESLSDGDDLGLIQQAMRERHAFQCAFCAPGFLMTVRCLLADNPSPTMAQIKQELSGNLCRCTGYASILDGVAEAVDKLAKLTSSPEGANDA